MTIIGTKGMKLHPDYEVGKAEYKEGYRDAINFEPIKSNPRFMYSAGYEQGLEDLGNEEQSNDNE
jgi:hypothetical protein